MECPYLSKDCNRLKQVTADSLKGLDSRVEEDRDQFDLISATGFSSSANTLIVGLCSTSYHINCAEYKRLKSEAD